MIGRLPLDRVRRLFRRRGCPDREFLVVQVLARHAAWFPAHNRGREAPPEALAAWEKRLKPLSRSELILILADNHARNLLLGKTWLPVKARRAG
jgi:hypothetical protein